MTYRVYPIGYGLQAQNRNYFRPAITSYFTRIADDEPSDSIPIFFAFIIERPSIDRYHPPFGREKATAFAHWQKKLFASYRSGKIGLDLPKT
jgi:hypothetical protein